MFWRLRVPFLIALSILLGSVTTEPARAGSEADDASGVPPPELPTDPTLADYLRVAQRRNPGLEVSYHEWQAARERIAQTGSLPDPQVSFAWFVEEVETRVGPQKQRLSLRQRLPWFGKLGLRKEIAGAHAEVAARHHELRWFELRRDVTTALYDLYELGRVLMLTKENVALLEELERSVRAKYRTSLATHADLVRIQVERDLFDDRVLAIQDRVRAVTARLNAFLHRPADAPVPVPQDLPATPVSPNVAVVRGAVHELSPSLRARENEVTGATAADRLARRERWPDWTLGVDWLRTGEAQGPTPPADSGQDAIALGVSVELPLFRGKHEGAVRETEQRLAAARAAREAELDRLVAAAEDALYRWRDAERREELYRAGLLSRARESLRVTRTAYETGEASFLDLIEAQRLLLEFELEHARALADRGRSAAELERITGRDWNEEVS